MIRSFIHWAAACALAGCGGGTTSGGGSGGTSPVNTPFAQSPSDTVSARLTTQSDTGLTTRMTTLRSDFTNVRVDNGGKKTAHIVLRPMDDGFTLTAFGQTKTYRSADLIPGQPFEFSVTDGQVTTYVWTFEPSWHAIETGGATSRYMLPFGTSTFDETTGINRRGYGVFGLETLPQNLPSGTSATYSGHMIADSYVEGNPNNIFQMYGRVTISADFRQGRMDGRIDQLIVGDIPQTSEFIIEPANISGNGYATSIRYDPQTCPGCGTLTASSVEGRFYGSVAQETGGTITFEGTSSEGYSYIAAGVIETAR